ncbi:hypothetical protein VN12_17950 [Pirellula sp. SH-Sr6A]|uniref:hypothetical protein n=1 Tax=Pirellula sp. SH-Sr6A TaxID=1632865 RepID=UPI00078C89F4|nr:hypothetical protein [Pirellula sp. SH-Sr6A]AMV34018.1 hypothetical protein VN12_17950 [Pirellula sp. SH-Sr6A]
MSWRRKALTIGLVLGAGVVSIGPVLSDSIAKRVAQSWNAQASIAKVEVSLPRAGLSLLGVRIERPDLCIQGNQVDLKLDRESLWYRDSVVESMVGKGFLITLSPMDSDRSEDANVLTTNHVAKTNQSLVAFRSACSKFESSLESQLNSARSLIQESEQKCQSRSLSIDERISRLRSEIAAFHDPAHRPNPLRASQRLEQIRSEANHIQQLLAEERLQRKQGMKACESTITSLSESIQALQQAIPKPQIATTLLLEESVRQSVADAERELLPYTKLLQIAVGSFFNSPIASSSHSSIGPHSIDQDLLLPDLRPRRSQILQCRISGAMEHAGTREPMVIQVVNPTAGSLADCARIQMEWGVEGTAPSTVPEMGAHTSGLAEKLTPDATTSSLRISVDREMTDTRIRLQRNWDGDQVQSKIVLSSRWISNRLPKLSQREGESTLLPPEEMIAIESASSVEGDGTWDIPVEQIAPLVYWFEQQWNRSIEERLEATQSKAKSLVSQEGENLRRRTLAMEETMNQRQSDWNQQLQDLLGRVADVEGEQLRAALSPATLTR